MSTSPCWTKSEKLRDANLTVNLKKRELLKPELRFLGFIVTGDGLKTDPSKVEAIQSFPTPKSVKEVRSFLGLASYYRRFVNIFSKIAAHLSKLTSVKLTKFAWGDAEQEAFEILKQALLTAPVLSSPDFDLPFSIHCNASNYGIGTALVQSDEENREHPIAYFSKTLTQREQSYSTTERELLCVVEAITHFRHYIEGYRFTVVTDHESLKWLHKLDNPTGRLARWATRLSQFDFDIIHKKGKFHSAPDAFSRVKVDTSALTVSPVPQPNSVDRPSSDDAWYNNIYYGVLHQPTKWLYLEPILSGDDGELGLKFRKVDQCFRQVARVLEGDSRISALVQSARLRPMLDSISEQLHSCQAALDHYIDAKRSIFPRFYFLSDDDLLELLGQARGGAEGRALVIQSHLRKLFPGITGVRLGPGDLSVTALCSHHREIFYLDRPVDIDCPVEVWLKNLENEMHSSLRNLMLNCLMNTSPKNNDVFSLPVQILCLAQNIRFTEQAERAITAKELHKLKSNTEKELKYYSEIETDEDNERLKRQALILQCAFYLSVIHLLIENNVAATSDWLWQKQLRFYLLSTKEVVAKMGLAELSYSYEYLGINTGQFARTELSDQCFLILSQAFHLGLVGNPFGPAGTGKTESVKALGALVGRLVLVFNCDEAMDGECMGRLLSGLARCGAWGCFDELNRLSAPTLAALSQHLSELLPVLADHSPAAQTTATINGNQIAVSDRCAVAATMNPAGRGYGGRRALPAALQRVLRPVAMCHPRGDVLARHLLAARAILNSQRLADDLQQVFYMASELLSIQRHYDWGLRALKATVGTCGEALAAAAPSRQRAVLRAALTQNNMSKLTAQDAHRFEAILSVVFTDVSEEELPQTSLTAAIEDTARTLNLVHNEKQVLKCMQLHEQLQQRMGVVLVGPPGCGKTTIRQLLRMALLKQGRSVVEYVICPKSMSRSCLLGRIDPDTRQWTDGVISTTALEISNQSTDVWSWVVCDGDIEPEWVEALNSVLDDNRLLTLPSGWRIQFGPNVNFIFETHTLEHASPATVSRMGVVLFSEENNYAEEVLNTWLSTSDFENDISKISSTLLQRTIKKIIEWFPTHHVDFGVGVQLTSLVKQILIQFEYVIQNTNSTSVVTPEELVYIALQRSLMSCLKHSSVPIFQEMISDILGVPPITSPLVGEWRGDGVYLSPRLARAEPAIKAAIAHSHLLVVGPPACAKSVMAEYILRETGNSLVINVDCTPILEPSDIIQELKRKNIVRAAARGSARSDDGGAVLLVRSLHRARVDAWGSSAIQAFLLQIIQHGGFWEQTGNGDGGRSVQWCGVRRVRVLATADARAARLCPRLTNAFCVLTLEEPGDEETLELTKNCLMQNINHKEVTENVVGKLAASMLNIYTEAKESFDSKIHYKWNVSDIKKWCANLKWYTMKKSEELLSIIEAEAVCIFKNKLVTENERTIFNDILKKHLKSANSSGTYFAAKLRGSGVYMEPIDYRDWYQATQKIINQCINEHDYSVFGDTGAEVCGEMSLLCPTIARATNGGVAVCVGSAGVGRRASAHIVASALPAALYTINFPSEFNMHMKNALSAAGGEGNRTVVLLCEPAVEARTLSAVEALLRARTAHALPTHILPALSHNHQPMQFLQNVKQNLGIVIILDKEQSDLSELMEKFPFLHRSSHLVWLDRWSNETLRQMPQLVIQRLIKEDVGESESEVNEAIPVDGFVGVYNTLETEWMRAPCRYVHFVRTYYNIVRRKKKSLIDRRKMLLAGVEALRRARNEVGSLQAEASQQEAALSEKRASATHALEQIGATVRTATRSKDEMHALKRNIEVENEKIQIRKKEIEAELAAVEPVIAAARAAVGDIKPEALSEVRSLRAPPDVVRDVLEGVLRLMGIADTSWHSMKNFLSKRGVKEDIRCLDASQISPEAAQSVRRLLERRGTSFDERVAKRASVACAPLAAWVRANLAHAEVLERVQPLQVQQRELHKNLQMAEAELAALSSGLEDIEERVSSLQEQLGRHTRDAATLELKLANVTSTLGAAQSLLQQLAAEYDVWEKDLDRIEKEIVELNLRSLLAASYIVYLAESTEAEEKDYLRKWSQLIGVNDTEFSVVNFLSTTEKQLKWDADGLPLDKTALKNAILFDQFLEPKKCGLTPLIIDPDGDAMAWLRNCLSGAPCDFLSQHSDRLQTAVHQCTRFGRILVVTEVDNIHPSYASLLVNLPASAGAGAVHSSFRLLLYTRDTTSSARLAPAHRALLTVLDFSARIEGLIDQLVDFALQHENPEVKERSRDAKVKKAALQQQQHELQENLLKDLSRNVDILHDASLLESLNKTRCTSTTIADALATARAAHQQAAAVRAAYEPGARCAARLGLSVRALSQRWPLVNLPVDVLLQLFVDAISNVGRIQNSKDDQSSNNDEIIKYLLKRITDRVVLALHKKDKYIVVLHLLKQAYESLIPDNLWQLFIQNYEQIIEDNDIKEITQKYTWIQKDLVKKVAAIQSSNTEFFNKLTLDDGQFWKEFQVAGDLSVLSKLKLSSFEQLTAVAMLRPESLYKAISLFVDQVLGSGVISAGDEVGRGARWGAGRAGDAPRPLLALGAHAADQIAAHAAAHARPLTQIWVGDGLSRWQAGVERARGGGWLLLALGAAPFSPDLCTFLAEFLQHQQEVEFDPEFRLWVVCEDRDIPPIVASACVNVILEAPEGVKNNVLNTLSAWGGFESPEPRLVRTVACLALLHALVQERRAYIPEGWSRWYEFEWGDVSACERVVSACGGGAGARACAAGLCEALYAGRVSAPPDAAVLSALVHDTLGEHTLSPSWKPTGLATPLPFDKRIKAYASALNALPSQDSAEMLGLAANCRVAWETKAAHNVLDGLKELYTTVDATTKNDGDTPLKFLLTLWKRLMSGSPFVKGHVDIRADASWWGCVCGGEAQEAARAARAVHAALGAARDRLAGPPLHNVPEEWLLLWWGPASPARYMRELALRARHAATRLQPPSAAPPDYFPQELDLRCFLNPRRLLAAFRARAATRLRAAPDALRLDVQWDCPTTGGDENAMVVQGLQLSGAVWGGALRPAPPRAPPHAPAPPLLVRYTQQESKERVSERGAVPVYASEARELLVWEVPAPPAHPPALRPRALTLNAVALFVAES